MWLSLSRNSPLLIPPAWGVRPHSTSIIPQSGNWQNSQERGYGTTSPAICGIDLLSQGEGSHNHSGEESRGVASLRRPLTPPSLLLQGAGNSWHLSSSWSETLTLGELWKSTNHRIIKPRGRRYLQGHLYPGPRYPRKQMFPSRQPTSPWLEHSH